MILTSHKWACPKTSLSEGAIKLRTLSAMDAMERTLFFGCPFSGHCIEMAKVNEFLAQQPRDRAAGGANLHLELDAGDGDALAPKLHLKVR